MQIDSNKKLKQFFNVEFSKFRNKFRDDLIKKPSKYFGEIGSTLIEDIPYKNQLDIKKNAIVKIFNGVVEDNILDQLEIVGSNKIYEYRLKMEFVSSFNPFYEPNNRLGQRKLGNFNWVVDMDECCLVDRNWFLKVRKVYEFLINSGVKTYDLVSHKGNLRYLVLKSYKSDAMLLIVATDFEDKIFKEAVKIGLELGFKSIYLIKNNTVSDSSEGEIVNFFGDSHLELDLGGKVFLNGPFTFFQNNIEAFDEILKYISFCLEDEKFKFLDIKNKVLYDLYCGVGVLGILFANLFKKIVGFDIVEESIELAQKNLKINGVENAYYNVKDLNKLDFKEFNSIDTNIVNGQVVIIDPPRAGLEKKGLLHIKYLKPELIIYISCNPLTQAIDVCELKSFGYVPVEMKSFDLFPHTYHIENVIFLTISK